MMQRVRAALVESFVGVIAVGWLFAEGITHVVTSLTMPIGVWMTERAQQEARSYPAMVTPRPHFPIGLVIPQLIAAALLLLLAWLSFRWLYLEAPAAGHASAPEPGD